jgi:ribosomal protein S10
LARNSKEKIKRTVKKYGIDLSSEIYIPTSIDEFKTREDFNKWKQQMKSFTNRANQSFQFRKNEYGVVASVKDINEAKRNVKKAKSLAEKRKKEVEKLPFISGGKEQGSVGQQLAQMKKADVEGLDSVKDFDFNAFKNQRHLNERLERLKQRADEKFFNKQQEQMKRNWLDKLSDIFNSDSEEIYRRFEAIPADDFYELFLMYDEMKFSFFYTLDTDEMDGHLQRLDSYIERYYRGQINMDLKNIK